MPAPKDSKTPVAEKTPDVAAEPLTPELQHAEAAARISGASAGVQYAGPMVKVNIPRGFILTDFDHRPYQYHAGEGQQMRKDHAEHFYAKAHGVEIVE